jgi:hypothetical protein
MSPILCVLLLATALTVEPFRHHHFNSKYVTCLESSSSNDGLNENKILGNNNPWESSSSPYRPPIIPFDTIVTLTESIPEVKEYVVLPEIQIELPSVVPFCEADNRFEVDEKTCKIHSP